MTNTNHMAVDAAARKHGNKVVHIALHSLLWIVATAMIVAVPLQTLAENNPQMGMANAQDDSLPQCRELLKECFVHGQAERERCFFSSARHPFCDGSQMARLAMKRWSMSSGRSGKYNADAALLGPQLVDQKCLQKFDNSWSSKLVTGDMDTGTSENQSLKNLDQMLDSCGEETTEDLSRP